MGFRGVEGVERVEGREKVRCRGGLACVLAANSPQGPRRLELFFFILIFF